MGEKNVTKDLSEKLTILILTYNRYSHLMRLLRYIDSVKPPFKINILDSSSDVIGINKDEFQGILTGNNISWLKYDTKIHPAQKIWEGIKTVATPYVVLWADDDFIIPHSLECGVEFLEKNNDFSIAHGHSGLFEVKLSSPKSEISSLGYYPQCSVANEAASERLINHLGNYSVTFYSIHRTDDMRRNFSLYLSYDIGLKFDELMLSCLSVIQGKAKKMDRLYMLRERHQSIDAWSQFIAAKTKRINYAGTKKNDFFDMIVGAEFSNNYNKFSECLAEELVKQDGITKDEALDVVKQAYWAYLSKGLMKVFQGRYGMGTSNLLLKAKIKALVKGLGIVKNHLLPIYHVVRSKIFSSAAISLPALIRRASPYHHDFMPVYRAVTSQNQNEN